jgi:hypothetical protein
MGFAVSPDAACWLDDLDREDMGSFNFVCHVLGLGPEVIRGLRRITRIGCEF